MDCKIEELSSSLGPQTGKESVVFPSSVCVCSSFGLRPDAIDPALRRPGRFDREMRFDLPTSEVETFFFFLHNFV